jgi:hypothetical protein
MESYRTSDLALASFLKMEGHEHATLEIVDGDNRSAVWMYLRNARIDKLLEDYSAGRARVEPKTFLSVTKDVRSTMFEALDAAAS